MTAPRARLRLWGYAIKRDAVSVARHGGRAPLWCERIRFDPRACHDSYGRFKPTSSGDVIGGEWDLQTYPFESNPIAAACLRRWRDGLSWEEAGAYKLQLSRIERNGGLADGCQTLEEIVRRYERLDEIFRTVQKECRLRPRNQTDDYTFWERDGILLHIARDCRPIFGQRGVHRFVMAKLLGFQSVPAQLGVVHSDAVEIWRREFNRGGALRRR